MPLKYPDILEHNNQSFALVDATELRGTSYPINSLEDTGSVPTDKRKVGQILFVTSSQQYYAFIGNDISNWDTPSNWLEIVLSGTNGINLNGTFSGSFSGSFEGDGNGLSNIPASGIVGLNLTQIATTNVTASVSEGTDTFKITSGSSTPFIIKSDSGNVGIGTTLPSAKLEVNGTTTLGGNAVIKGKTTLYGDISNSSFPLSYEYKSSLFSKSNVLQFRQGGSTPGAIMFTYYDINPMLTMIPSTADNAKVGINQPNPTQTLDVSGSGRFTDGLTITGSINQTGDLNIGGKKVYHTIGGGTYYIGGGDDGGAYTGDYSTYIGDEAGLNLTSSAFYTVNTFVGYGAGKDMSGYFSTGFGAGAGRNTKAYSGNLNLNPNTSTGQATAGTFFGTSAGRDISAVNNSQFIGTSTGYGLKHSFRNVFIGENSGRNNASSFDGRTLWGTDEINIFRSVAIGSSNFGYIPQTANKTITDSIAIGFEAGIYAAVTQSILIGTYAGFNTGGVTGENIIHIGNNSTINPTTSISSPVAYPTKDISNIILIGNNIQPTQENTIYFPLGYTLGLNTHTPNTSYTLDVSGSGRFTDGLNITGSLTVSGSSTLTNYGPAYFMDGNVGIGTTNPQAKLHVEGSSVNEAIFVAKGSQGGNLVRAFEGGGGQVLFTLNGSSGDFVMLRSDSANSYINTAKLGIGTTSPSYKLDVTGTGRFTDGLTITGSINQTGDLTIDGILTAREFHTELVSSSIIYESGSTKFGDTSDDVHQFTGSIQQSGSNSYFLGKVGIGTTSPTLGGSAGIDIYNQSYPQLRLHNAITGTNITSGFLIGLTTTDVQLKNYENSPITISTNDSPRMTILGGGNVGVGTTSPSYTLDVSGSGNFTDGLTVTGSLQSTNDITINNNSDLIIPATSDWSTGGEILLTKPSTFRTAVRIGRSSGGGGDDGEIEIFRDGVSRFKFTGNGNNYINPTGLGSKLGIGTTTPTAKIHLFSSTHSDFLDNGILIDVSSSDEGEPAIAFRNQSDMGSNYWIAGINNGGGNLDFAYGSLFTTATTKVRFANNGRVGIGTTSPTSNLHIYGTDNLIQIGDNTSGNDAYISLNNRGYIGFDASGGMLWQSTTTRPFNIAHGAGWGDSLQSRLYIDLSGNVGIGTTSPTYKLDVSGSGRFTNTLYVSGSDTSSTTEAFKVVNSSGDIGIQVLNNKNVGIGGEAQTSATYKLRVHGGLWADSLLQLVTLAGTSGVGSIRYYQGGATLNMDVYGPHPSEAVKGILQLRSQDLNYTTLQNSILHADPDFLDNPSFVIRSRNTDDESYAMMNYKSGSGFMLKTSEPPGTGTADITFKPSGSAVLFLSSSGNVGIGTTSPSYKLDVSGSGRFTDGLSVTGSLTVSGSSTLTNYGPAYFMDGNVGIGTASPSSKLHVSGSGGGSDVLLIEPAGAPTVSLKSNSTLTDYSGLHVGNKYLLLTKNSSAIFQNIQGGLMFANGLAAKSVITENGYFGIGFNTTTGIDYPLDVKGDARISGSGIFTNDLDVSGSLHVLGDLTVGKISNQTKLLDVGGNFNFDTVAEPSSPERAAFSASIVSSPGNIDNGTHYYHVIYKTADGGETGQYGTPFLEAIITDNTTAGQVQLTGIPTSSDARVTARDIYRTQANQSQYYGRKLATLNDNTTTTYLDNLADSSLDLNTQFYRKANSTAGYFYKDNVLFGQAGNIHYTSFGVGALQSVTIGQDNVAFGGSTLQQTTSGKENTAIGYAAGVNNTTGNHNTYLGYVAGYFNQTGNYNTQVGAYAGRLASQTVASSNTHVGYSSGFQLTTNNNNNVGLGFRAGSGFQGSNNINIGYGAGYVSTAATRGDNNITIGFNAGQYTTGDGNILLGREIEAPNSASDGQLSIGNLIFGTGLSTSGNAMSTGNVGIGTASPSHKLDVSGSGRFDGVVQITGSLNLVENSTRTIEINPNDRKIVIGGATDYTAQLHLNNGRIQFGRDGNAGGGYFFNNDSDMQAQMANSFYVYDSSIAGDKPSPAFGELSQIFGGGGSVRGGFLQITRFKDTSDDTTFGREKVAHYINAIEGGTGPFYLSKYYNSGSEAFSVKTSGDTYISGSLGIGTTSPSAKLDVSGSGRFTDGLTITGSLTVSGSSTLTNYGPAYFMDGNVGIGTTSPTDKLQVQSTQVKFTSETSGEDRFTFSSGDDGNNSTLYMYNSQESNTVRIASSVDSFFNGGNVGIGTTSPSYRLELSGSDAAGRTIGIDGDPVIYYPDQDPSAYDHSIALGNGLRNATNTGGNAGTRNTAIGIDNQTDVTTGGSNVSVGSSTLQYNTTGNNNITMGHLAGQTIRGNSNTVLGFGSLRFTATGSSNVALGIYAGYEDPSQNVVTETNNSLYLGGYTKASSTTGNTNEIVIGYQAEGLGSNTVVLGNDSITTTALKGNVGIGTTSPSNKLDVVGAISTTTGIRVGSAIASEWIKRVASPTVSNGIDLQSQGVSRLFAGSNVGIGTTSPTYKLHIVDPAPSPWGGLSGSLNVDDVLIVSSSNVGIGTTSPSEKLEVVGSVKIATNNHQLILEQAGGTLVGRLSYTGATLRIQGNDGIRFEDTNGSTIHGIITDAGNFGIGTTSASYKLHVNGTAQIGEDSSGLNNYLYIQADTNKARYIHFKDNATRQAIGFPAGSQNLEIKSLNGGANSGILVDYSTGRINIGHTDTNSAVLHIKGEGVTSSTTALRVEDANASASLVVRDDGNVGIGTTSPQAKLHVSGTSDVFLVEGSGSTLMAVDGVNGRLFEVTDDLSDSLFSVNTIAGLPVLEVFADNTVKMGAFNQNDLIVTGSNVGIGTTTPAAKLHVSGTAQFDDVLTLTPQDPLPSGVPTGSFAVSSSIPPKPYFYDGTNWNSLY